LCYRGGAWGLRWGCSAVWVMRGVGVEESWHQARLIPTSGISGVDEQERRATSALLAVMAAVREFGRGLTMPLGAPAGPVETFIEVPFSYGEVKCVPDGLVRVSRGQRTWTALVEVKTGSNVLGSEQLEAYLDVAREQGFDAVVTVSNEIPPVPGQHPDPGGQAETEEGLLVSLVVVAGAGRGGGAEGAPWDR
jgi:hypothetical protein